MLINNYKTITVQEGESTQGTLAFLTQYRASVGILGTPLTCNRLRLRLVLVGFYVRRVFERPHGDKLKGAQAPP